jgi:pyruvate dehydrogenase E1 component beta subunit
MAKTMVQAINAGLRRVLATDPSVVLMGEDIGRLGGVFRVTEGLQDTFGAQRVMDSPLAESGILGTAIGMAMRGYRPIVEIQFDGFVYPAFDQIVSQLAKFHRRSQGIVQVPVVVRIPYGGGIGAVEHHSESPEAYFAHTAGLRMLSPADPPSAYRMIQQAVASPDPVLFLEPKRRYWDRAEFDEAQLDEEVARVDPWKARVVRHGSDVTVACYGPMVRTCLEAAQVAATEGIAELEVLDLQSLAPVDYDAIERSVTQTGRLVVVHEAPLTVGLGAEIAATLTERCFYVLQAPVMRVTGFDIPYPASRLEHAYLPSVDRILDAVEDTLEG